LALILTLCSGVLPSFSAFSSICPDDSCEIAILPNPPKYLKYLRLFRACSVFFFSTTFSSYINKLLHFGDDRNIQKKLFWSCMLESRNFALRDHVYHRVSAELVLKPF